MSNTILVVDDEPDLVQLYSMILKMQGYQVRSAIGGQQAIQEFDRSRPDLVLLDVMMPDTNGIEVCKYIRSVTGHSQYPIVLMYTADDSTQNRHESSLAGANDLISKTVPVEQITERIESHLGALTSA